MFVVIVERQFDTPPDQIWEFITNVARMPEWMPDIRQAEIISPQQEGMGRQHLVRTESKISKSEITQQVDFWEPPVQYGWQQLREVVDGREMKQVRDLQIRFDITPTEPRCTVTITATWEAATLMGWLRSALIMKRKLQKDFEETLGNLQRLVSSPK